MPEWIVRMEERPEPRYAEPLTERSDEGVVLPIPTLPPLVTTNFVAVVDPMANAGPVMPFGLMESWAHGLVEPTPTLPLLSILIRSPIVPALVV